MIENNNLNIRELDFADLMIWDDGRAFFRHAKGLAGPVSPADQSYHQDIERLKVVLNAENSHEFFLNYDGVPYRVARIQTINGCGYFLRRPKFPIPDFVSLGFKSIVEQTLSSLGNKQGMILFAGATGSGKSTSMYSLMHRFVEQYGDIAIGIEDPPEIPVQGCYGRNNSGLWYQVDAAKAGGYEKAMVSAMRYNPRYILIGEIRTPVAANEAIRAAVNGHVVMTTIHGNSVTGAILALQQIATAATGSQDLARSILADGLLAVVHQKLQKTATPGVRSLEASVLYFGDDLGMRAKVRSGKLELLSSDLVMQQHKIERGQSL